MSSEKRNLRSLMSEQAQHCALNASEEKGFFVPKLYIVFLHDSMNERG